VVRVAFVLTVVLAAARAETRVIVVFFAGDFFADFFAGAFFATAFLVEVFFVAEVFFAALRAEGEVLFVAIIKLLGK
jgi:hypothetical protein